MHSERLDGSIQGVEVGERVSQSGLAPLPRYWRASSPSGSHRRNFWAASGEWTWAEENQNQHQTQSPKLEVGHAIKRLIGHGEWEQGGRNRARVEGTPSYKEGGESPFVAGRKEAEPGHGWVLQGQRALGEQAC